MSTAPHFTDHQQLLYALRRLLGISREALSPRYNTHHEISDALSFSGISTWSQLITIRDSDIDNLAFDVTRFGVAVRAGDSPMRQLSIAHKGQIRALIAYYHHESRRLKYEALPQYMDPTDFDTFRASTWDPNVIPTPWMQPLPAIRKDLQEWQKTAKPSHSDYPTLTENSNMNKFLEQWESVARAHWLSKTLDKNYVPAKDEEDLHNHTITVRLSLALHWYRVSD